ncbi:lysosomal alpha-mannosidase-like isoform X2 [Adelges cooleyi]|uniref:lysosomal alpha-mannosidase-like isoform X2 n=1 Tax=Adelges cooleyi TaxID=133065 RepID=UPI00217F7287|nr:lysosomal alpha-mannosidase-like isoform X2 [Adelges cooleyi]
MSSPPFIAVVVLLTLYLTRATARPKAADGPSFTGQCGYESCPAVKDGYLNVHFVPHSHDDVGWLKTVDQYYFGTNTSIQMAGVQFILDSVVEALSKDPNKRFIYVETAFFWKWWIDQNEDTQTLVKNLVSSGRLEFIGGAWSMNDEANANYISIIDQFTWGLRKLNDTFGECGRPHIGWQIDPFGHSRQMATLFSQFGYDGLFFARLDYEDKMQRLSKKSAEMIWQSSPNLGSSANLFTHVLYNFYSPPDGFCFDVVCGIDPIVDDIKSPAYNVEAKTADLLAFLDSQAKGYQDHGNVILTMGGDFTYQDASYYYKSLDKLIKHINSKQSAGSKINAIYSTPSCYLKAVNDKNLTFPTKDDDFFPYKSDKHAYWTGYFTSRPTQKYYERRGNNILQACKQLAVQSLAGPQYEPKITPLREAMGVMQHHDAITGTEKQHVANDYARILSEAIGECEEVSFNVLSGLSGDRTSKFETCDLLNISVCAISEQSEQFVLTLYNPLSRPVTEFARLPVLDNTEYDVVDPQGNNLTTQIIPLPKSVITIPGRTSPTTAELIFKATDLPPLGYKSYLITKNRNGKQSTRSNAVHESSTSKTNAIHIGDEKLGLTVDFQDSRNFTIHLNGEDRSLLHEFMYYKSMVGDNTKDYKRASGAYIFRPNGTAVSFCDKQNKPVVFKGPLVDEAHIVCNDWASHVIRKYQGDDHFEFEWLVGPIPYGDRIGKEIISRYKLPQYRKNKTFYTDSNGREMLQRVLNYRSSFDLKQNAENISGNYYPITSRIMFTNGQTLFAVLNDRAQGGSSLDVGEIELMVHRRMFYDDAFGVEEPLNEHAFGTGLVARGQHYIAYGSVDEQNAVQRLLAQKKLIRPQYFFTKKPSTISHKELNDTTKLQFYGMKNLLPVNVQVLTLEPWKEGTILLRLEHIFEYNEDTNLSKPVVVNIQDLFTKFRIVSLRETILGGNQWLSENNKLSWRTDDNDLEVDESPTRSYKTVDPTHILLTPMQIRTFVSEIIPLSQ